MDKDYILSRQDLKNVIIGAKTFIAERCREMIARGQDPTKLTYRQTDAVIDDYIDSLKEVKLEEVLDKVDEILEHTTGISINELLKRELNEKRD